MEDKISPRSKLNIYFLGQDKIEREEKKERRMMRRENEAKCNAPAFKSIDNTN